MNSNAQYIYDREDSSVCFLCQSKSSIVHDDSGWEKLLDALNGIDDNDDDPYGGYLPPGNEINKTAEEWRKEGKCPRCGELGRFSHFQYICSIHGAY